MTLEDIMAAVSTDKLLGSIGIPVRGRDEYIELYLEEITPDSRYALERVLYGLKRGIEFDIIAGDLTDETSFIRDVRSLSELETHIGFSARVNGTKIEYEKLPEKILEIEYIPGIKWSRESKNTFFNKIFGKKFEGTDTETLIDNIRNYVKEGNAIEIKLTPNKQKRLTLRTIKAIRNNIEKGLETPKQKFTLYVDKDEKHIMIKKRRRRMTLDLEKYRIIKGDRHPFTLTKTDIFGIEPRHLNGGQVEKSREKLGDGRPDYNESILKAHIALGTNDYRSAIDHIKIAKKHRNNSILPRVLESKYRGAITRETNKALHIVRSLEDFIFNYDLLMTRVTEQDRLFFNHKKHKRTDKRVRGVLGEMLGLGLMRYLRDVYYNDDITILSGEPGKREKIYGTNYEIHYRKSGRNFMLKNLKTGEGCEIDNMMIFNGVPIILESKIGLVGFNKMQTAKQRNFIKSLYKIEPVQLDVAITEQDFFRSITKYHHRLSLPFYHRVYRKSIRVFKHGQDI